MKKLLSVLSVIMVVYTLIVFIVPFDHSTALFWISYAAVAAAAVMQVFVFNRSFSERENNDAFRSGHSKGISDKMLGKSSLSLKSKVYGFPIFRVGYIYFGVQIILSSAFMLIGSITDEFPLWICLIEIIIVMGLALLGTITTDSARNTIEAIEKAGADDNSFMMKLRLDSANLVNKTNDPVLKKKLTQLAENIKFSDPVSNEKTKEYNNKLRTAYDELEKAVGDADASASDVLAKVQILLDDRNRTVKMNK